MCAGTKKWELGNALMYNLEEMQSTTRWRCFSYEKQDHLRAKCNTSILCLKALVNSHTRISILAFPRLLPTYNFWHEIKKTLDNFGIILDNLILVTSKNPLLHWRHQDHNYMPAACIIILHLQYTDIVEGILNYRL